MMPGGRPPATNFISSDVSSRILETSFVLVIASSSRRHLLFMSAAEGILVTEDDPGLVKCA
jgi:hypothetical protein